LAVSGLKVSGPTMPGSPGGSSMYAMNGFLGELNFALRGKFFSMKFGMLWLQFFGV
jgi:hypothetical protein